MKRGARRASLLVLLIVGAAAEISVSEVAAATTQQQSEIAPWSEQNFGGLYLRVPATLTPMDPQVPPEAADFVESAEAYGWESDTLGIRVIFVIGKPEVPVSLDNGVAAAIRGMSQLPGSTGFRSEQHALNISGSPAVRLSMWYTQGGESFIAGTLYVVRGQRAWIVVVIAPDNPEKRAVLDQVISSASLR
jgi:hypothetical protein